MLRLIRHEHLFKRGGATVVAGVLLLAVASRAQSPRGFGGGYGQEPEMRVAADGGIGQLYFGDGAGVGVATQLRGEWTSPSLGFGLDVFAAGSFGDLGVFDAPGVFVRVFPYLTAAVISESHDWRVGLRIGPDFQRLAVGDEFYFEFDGFGLRTAVDAEFRLSGTQDEGLFATIGFGVGFGSGDVEFGAPGLSDAAFEDDTNSLDLQIGLAYELPSATVWVSYRHQSVTFDAIDDAAGFDGLFAGISWRF